ncbi:hypothetical protein NWE74_05115 [Romboutsia lituseburensis]|nr:hypothetical protein [Romboutsia lituseburensis]MCR8744673.1 hypothetical protein [Romboutsia lituseburensis]
MTIDSEKAFFGLLCREYKMLFQKIGDKRYINKRLTPELKKAKSINLLFLKEEIVRITIQNKLDN